MAVKAARKKDPAAVALAGCGKTRSFGENTAKSRLAGNYASMESEAYTHQRAAISHFLQQTGVFPQPARAEGR
jgi:hypothetical protein